MKSKYIAGILCMFLFCTGFTVALSNSGGGNWNYFGTITLTETSGSTLNNYQVPVILNSENFEFERSNVDGSDIRFTDNEGNEKEYWIEEWNSEAKTAIVWVKVPVIPASGYTNFKIWYGNPSATSSSNGDATFEFFDDFQGSALNTNKWNTYTIGTNARIEVADGIVKIISPSVGSTAGIYSNAFFKIDSVFVAKRAKFTTGPDSRGPMQRQGFLDVNIGDGNQNVIDHGTEFSSESWVRWVTMNSGTTYSPYRDWATVGIPEGTFYISGVGWQSVGGTRSVSWYKNNQRISSMDFSSNTYVPSSPMHIWLYSSPYGGGQSNYGYMAVDYVYVRKCASSEPIVSVSEENGNNPILSLHFDEGSGTVAHDSSGNGNDGTINGATWVHDVFGNALTFDGINDFVDVPLKSSLAGDVTFSLWMKNNYITTYVQRMGDLGTDTNLGLQLCLGMDGKVCIDNLGGPSSQFYTDEKFNDGKWHQVTGVRKGNNYDLYVDGTLRTSTSGSIPSYNHLYIGKRAPQTTPIDHYYKGIIDEVEVYPRALTAAEVLASYNSNPSISLTLPNGGESWPQGSVQTILWTYTGDPGSDVKIELVKGDEVAAVITESTSIGSGGSGSYSWTVPSTLDAGSDYRVQITSTSNPSISGMSDNPFTIIPPSTISISRPNGGDPWFPNSIQIINWTYTGVPSQDVKIELFKGELFDSMIIQSTSMGSEGAGNFSWYVPSTQISGNDYKIKVTSNSNPSVSDMSESTFTIAEESLNGKTAIVILFHTDFAMASSQKYAWDKTQTAIDWIESKSPAKFEILSIGGTKADAIFVDHKNDAIIIQDGITFNFSDTSIHKIVQQLTINGKQITSEEGLVREVKNFGKNRGGYDHVIILLAEDSYLPDNSLTGWYTFSDGEVIWIQDSLINGFEKDPLQYVHEILHCFQGKNALDNYNKYYFAQDGTKSAVHDIMYYKAYGSLSDVSFGKETQTELGMKPGMGLLKGKISFYNNNIPMLTNHEYTISITNSVGETENYTFLFDVAYKRDEYAIALTPGNYLLQASSIGYISSQPYPISISGVGTLNRNLNYHTQFFNNPIQLNARDLSSFFVIVFCPIDISVEDPLGRIITKSINEIPDAEYVEIDLNNDNSNDDYVYIESALNGTYKINVEPESGADPSDVFSLIIITQSGKLVLADNVSVGNIPKDPYQIYFSKNGVCALSSVSPLQGYSNPPTDPDGDCIYEDLNGNGRLDFADVVLYFNQMTWIAANEPVSAFDLNGNGRIDFADIVALFNEI